MVVCFIMMVTMVWASLADFGPPVGIVTYGNLVWLQNANCYGTQNWNQVMNSAASLKSGMCGLKDGSKAGQWRLPTQEELKYRQKNTQGFYNVQRYYYWSSTDSAAPGYAKMVNMADGYVSVNPKNSDNYFWAVRSVQ